MDGFTNKKLFFRTFENTEKSGIIQLYLLTFFVLKNTVKTGVLKAFGNYF